MWVLVACSLPGPNLGTVREGKALFLRSCSLLGVRGIGCIKSRGEGRSYLFKDILESLMEEVGLNWIYTIKLQSLNQCGTGT